MKQDVIASGESRSDRVIRVGFIGLGEQGKPMAINLAKAGFELTVHDVRREPVEELAAMGARVAESPREVGALSDVIEVVVVDDAQVERVVLGDDGIVAGARPGSVVAIHSTVRPATIRKVASECGRRGIGVIDAPVSGGAFGAEQRAMSYMVGGDAELVEQCRPVFETSGKSILHVGPLCAGMTAKLAHQVIICINVLATSEGMALAKRSGLDPSRVQEVVRAGGAQSRIADNWVKHAPAANAIKLWRKDLELALECADELGLELPVTSLVRQVFERVTQL
ncbi:MAG: NAD(P)-dependent oxidoreductase [Candidatus Binatus sp.]|uniref:NAD(P)-dependent oxidoreductase n=1 Tax=Candidatus Binatus sp. TaxID=2811406 RepID=UPI002728DE6C|nr:NAD(P)-dependent oxidoreductase [Candidatus Binatus sp.]MDO8432161.1 NAD(P)-dependent oxidoreductase [Candidatus Binatus sp.]